MCWCWYYGQTSISLYCLNLKFISLISDDKSLNIKYHRGWISTNEITIKKLKVIFNRVIKHIVMGCFVSRRLNHLRKNSSAYSALVILQNLPKRTWHHSRISSCKLQVTTLVIALSKWMSHHWIELSSLSFRSSGFESKQFLDDYVYINEDAGETRYLIPNLNFGIPADNWKVWGKLRKSHERSCTLY